MPGRNWLPCQHGQRMSAPRLGSATSTTAFARMCSLTPLTAGDALQGSALDLLLSRSSPFDLRMHQEMAESSTGSTICRLTREQPATLDGQTGSMGRCPSSRALPHLIQPMRSFGMRFRTSTATASWTRRGRIGLKRALLSVAWPQKTVKGLGPPGKGENRDPHTESGTRRAGV